MVESLQPPSQIQPQNLQPSAALGKHILVEFYHCSSTCLGDTTRIEHSMIEAAKDCGATIVDAWFHHFSPVGVSGVVIIQESHLTIHTWPEYHYAAVDLFTCGHSIDPWLAYKVLEQALEAKHTSVTEIERGQINLLERAEQRCTEQPRSDSPSFQGGEELREDLRQVWFTEHNPNIALSFRRKGDRLFKGQSPFQTVEVFDTHAYGRLLVIDNKVMCSERDEQALP